MLANIPEHQTILQPMATNMIWMLQPPCDLYGRKEGNVLFNNALNTFLCTVIWHQTDGKGPLRQRERKPAATTWATLSDQQQKFFYMHHPIDRITYTMAFVTPPVMEHWLEHEIAQWIHHEGLIWWPTTPWANALTTELHFIPYDMYDEGCLQSD